MKAAIHLSKDSVSVVDLTVAVGFTPIGSSLVLKKYCLSAPAATELDEVEVIEVLVFNVDELDTVADDFEVVDVFVEELFALVMLFAVETVDNDLLVVENDVDDVFEVFPVVELYTEIKL